LSEGHTRTDSHARQDKAVVWAATDRIVRLRLLKVDATERGVTRLKTAKERALHWVHRVDVERGILGRLLRRALRLPGILVL
jgi:hypothetical protein